MQTLKENMGIFLSEIERLQRGLKGNYSQEQIDLLFEQTKKFKVDHLKETVNHLLSMKTFLPPPNDVIIGCRVASYGDEMKEDQEEKEFAKEFFEGKAPIYGQVARESTHIILDKLNGKITIHQLYQKMLIMNDNYPGRGWKEEAQKVLPKPILRLASNV